MRKDWTPEKEAALVAKAEQGFEPEEIGPPAPNPARASAAGVDTDGFVAVLSENGDNVSLTAAQRDVLLAAGAIYWCGDCDDDVPVYHITPGMDGLSPTEIVAGLARKA